MKKSHMDIQKSMSPRELNSDFVRDTISSVYILNVIETPILMEEGVENAAYLIKTNKEKFVVKVFVQNVGPKERIIKEVKLCNFLIKNGINVPEIIQSKRGEFVEEISINNFKFFMFLMVHQDLRRVYPNNIRKQELIKISQEIAKMNKILQSYPDVKITKEQDNLHKHIDSLSWFEVFTDSPNSKIYNGKEIEHLKTLNQQMYEYYSNNIPGKNLTESIIHGDLALGHTRFLPNNEVYFFDFTDFAYGPVSQEIAVFLNNLYRENGISFEKWEEFRKIVLNTYSSEMSINKHDLKAIIPLIVRRISGEILYLSDFANKIGKPVNVDGNKRRFELAKYLIERFI